MTIVNQNGCGANTYIVSVQTGFMWPEDYQVHANSEKQAKEYVANFLSDRKYANLYFENDEVKAIVGCSSAYKDENDFAAIHNLECCGREKIYIEFVSVKMI